MLGARETDTKQSFISLENREKNDKHNRVSGNRADDEFDDPCKGMINSYCETELCIDRCVGVSWK